MKDFITNWWTVCTVFTVLSILYGWIYYRTVKQYNIEPIWKLNAFKLGPKYAIFWIELLSHIIVFATGWVYVPEGNLWGGIKVVAVLIVIRLVCIAPFFLSLDKKETNLSIYQG
jgi:hypothetical protein